MTVKQKVIQAVRELPAEASYEDVMERVLLLSKIESGIAQLDAGEGIPHEKVKQRLKRWLK
jgi:predicted transcriptional regulator